MRQTRANRFETHLCVEVWRDHHPPQHAHRCPSVEVFVESGVNFVNPRSNTLRRDRRRRLKADGVGPGGGLVMRARASVDRGVTQCCSFFLSF